MIEWLKEQYREWMIGRVICSSVQTMHHCAQTRLDRRLSFNEREDLQDAWLEFMNEGGEFGQWEDLMTGEPGRLIQIFLSRVIWKGRIEL